jgi:outer membrane protein assembly factor BamB
MMGFLSSGAMRRFMSLRLPIFLLAVFGVFCAWSPPAHAVIVRLTPLGEVLELSSVIVTVSVESIDPKAPGMVLKIDKSLKGKPGFTKLAVNLKGDAVSLKGKETAKLLKRVGAKEKLVLFIHQRDKEFLAFGFTNGTWFGLSGVKADGALRWSFNHFEPYLRRTYKGTTQEMIGAVTDVLAGKKKPPPVDKKAKPGLGPELPVKKKSTGAGSHSAQVEVQRAVIVAPPVGALLALLAMMFPTVFGGWKRWLVLLCVLATNSTLFGLHYYFGSRLPGWWSTPTALWVVMTQVTLLGLLWAWSRHLGRVRAGEAPARPGLAEVIALLIISAAGVGVVAYCRLQGIKLTNPNWLPLVVFSIGIWAGVLYVMTARWLRRAQTPPLATEILILTGMIFACTALPAFRPATKVAAAALLESGEQDALTQPPPRQLWTFRLPGRGAIHSSPIEVNGKVFVAAGLDNVFRPEGVLYCLDGETGKEVWKFNDGQKMRPVYSSPCVVDGRVYIGEGFHQDAGCKVYCVQAKNGEKIWEFPTASHTESSPAVANGKVYIGAGDDGFYCLDAARGTKLWQFPGFHFDASPVVEDGRVYVGAGIGDYYQLTGFFCLDGNTGKRLWTVPTKLPIWGRAVVAGGFVYVGSGNGRVNESPANPAGEVMCLRASDGEIVWSKKLPDAALANLVADGRHLYVGTRDNGLNCIRLADGKQVWKRTGASPVVNSPALELCAHCGKAESLFVAGAGGDIQSLDPATGKVLWTSQLPGGEDVLWEVFSSPALVAKGNNRAVALRLIVAGTQQSTARSAEVFCFEETPSPSGTPGR